MAKTSPPASAKLDGKKPRPKQETDLELAITPISPVMLENVQNFVTRLLTIFPATPKLTYPDPGGYWGVSPFFDPILGPTFGAMVGVKTNKTAVAHHITVLDLTNPAIVIPPKVIPAPVPSAFWAIVGVALLVSGHDYRVRVEVDPAAANPNDEYDTVYATLT